MHNIKLPDGRFIVSDFFEIIEFPTEEFFDMDKEMAFKKNKKSMQNMLFEFYKTSDLNTTSLELMFLTESVEKQAFRSRIRVFFVIRKIGNSLEQLEVQTRMIKNQIVSTLNVQKYELDTSEKEEREFLSLMKNLNSETMFSVVKSEQMSGNAFYGWSTLNEDSQSTMSGFLDVLSQQEKCCVSFQIIPTELSAMEKNALNQTYMMYEQSLYGNKNFHSSLAETPMKSIQYVIENTGKPLFFYNICLWGSQNACRLVTPKLLSLLQSGEKKISENNLLTLDLTRERITPYDKFFLYPWIINEKLIKVYRNQNLQSIPLVKQMCRMPYMMTEEELNVFFRLPLYDKTMPALKVRSGISDTEQFKEAIVGENTIKIGNVVSRNKDVVIGCPMKSWTQHALIVGMPGTGKTTFCVNILSQFVKKGIPFLAIEPTKAEYRAMIDAIEDLQIFTPGNTDVSPFIINPFIPPRGVRLEQYIPSLVSAFKAAFSMDGPLEMLFLKAVNECYVEHGWKARSKYGDEDVTIFGLYEYIICFKKVLQSMDYNKDVRTNLETAGVLRLMNLIEQNSSIYDNVNTVSIEDLLSKPTVVELNAIENQEQKALIMSLLLSSICTYTKNNRIGDGQLKNVILIDEAHVLLDIGAKASDEKASDSTVRAIQNMIAEIRSYGTSIIIADQKPSKVTDDIVANTNVKVAFRLASPKERTLIAESTDMSDVNKEQISRLEVGQAFVHFDQLYSPQLVQTEDTRERDGIRLSVSNAEIKERSNYWNDKKERLIPYRECSCVDLCKSCSFEIREDAEYYASKYLSETAPTIKEKKHLLVYAINIPKFLRNNNFTHKDETFERVCCCTMVKYIRKAQLSLSYRVSQDEIGRTMKFMKENI